MKPRYYIVLDGNRYYTRTGIWTRERYFAGSFTREQADTLIESLRPIVGHSIQRRKT